MRFIPVLLISTTLCFTVFPTSTLHAKAPQAQPRPLVSGERVRVKKITRDITSAMQELDKNGVKPFQVALMLNGGNSLTSGIKKRWRSTLR